MARSLTRIQIQNLVILLLCLAVAGFAGYYLITDIQRASYQKRISLTARGFSAQISDLIEQQRSFAEKIAAQADTIDILQRGKPRDRLRKSEEIKSITPYVLAAHLLPVDFAAAPSSPALIEPVCRDFVRRAALSDTASSMEFHTSGTLSDHYDIVQTVADKNKKVLGYVLLSFARAPLQALLERNLPETGYIEVRQETSGKSLQVVAKAGAKNPETYAGSVTSSLNYAPWTLVYWPDEPMPRIITGSRLVYVLLILLAVAVLVIITFRLHRITVRSVRHDIKSLLRMLRDVRDGSVRVGYPMELNEFANAFQYMRDSGQKLVKEKEKLKDMGLIDHLSQLSNRRHFEMRLKELFDLSKTHGPSSVLIIDVDHFKSVNDEHGHDAGDALIVGFAKALREAVRQSDMLARLGGDEFCVIYTYVSLKKAEVLAQRLRRQLPRDIPLTKGIMHHIRWTGGVSVIADKDKKFGDVLWRADQALIQAKEAGRNMTRIYDPASGPPKKPRIITS